MPKNGVKGLADLACKGGGSHGHRIEIKQVGLEYYGSGPEW